MLETHFGNPETRKKLFLFFLDNKNICICFCYNHICMYIIKEYCFSIVSDKGINVKMNDEMRVSNARSVKFMNSE